MPLQLYDTNHKKIALLDKYKDYHLPQAINVDDTLYFSYPISDPQYPLIAFECYIRDGTNEFVVKERNMQGSVNGVEWAQFVCKVNLEELKGTVVSNFQTVSETLNLSASKALIGTNWTVGFSDVGITRTVSKAQCTVYDVLMEIVKVYSCEIRFDAVNKVIDFHLKQGSDRGAYFSEQINLKTLTSQSNSNSYITRLIPIGKNGLNITSVNNGVNYVENYQYSTKIITGYWVDNRYEVAQDLKDDAISRLSFLSKPTIAYSASVIDIAKVSNDWSVLDYMLGDVITLLSESKGVKEQQRIIKIDRYPDEPERSTVEIANKIAKLEDIILKVVDASDVVNNVTDTTGAVVANSVSGNLNNAYIPVANVGDLSATLAQMGTALINKAEITSLDAAKARISTLEVNSATIDQLDAAKARISTLEVNSATIDQLDAEKVRIDTLETTTAHITDGVIDNATIDVAKVNNLSSTYATVNQLDVTNENAQNLKSDVGYIVDLTAHTLKAGVVTANSMSTGLITAESGIIANSAIGTAQIADSSITDGKIVSMSANRLTAGRIDAGVITVVNLNAENITTGYLNGQRIADGAINNDHLSTDVQNSISTGVTANTKIDNLVIDGTNILKNTAKFQNTNFWYIETGSGQTTTLDIVNDGVYGNVLHLNKQNAVSWSVLCNSLYDYYPQLFDTNKDYTLSFWVKGGAINTTTSFTFIDANGQNGICDGKTFTITTANTWLYYSYTFKPLAKGNQPVLYIQTDVGEFWLTQFKLEMGNKATGWSPSMAELQDAGFLTTGTLLADRIAANTITGDKIVVDAITSREIASRTITANEILAGTITANEIAVKTITSDKLCVGDSTNLAVCNELTGSIASSEFSTTTVSNGYIGRTNNGSTFFMITNKSTIPFRPGEKLYYEFYASSDIGLNCTFGIWTYTATSNNASTTSPQFYIGTTESKISGYINVPNFDPSTTVNFVAGFYDVTNKNIKIRKVFLRRIVDATFIADGSITTNKLVAGAVTADKIAAGTITADKINTTNLSAEKITKTSSAIYLSVGDSKDKDGVTNTGVTINKSSDNSILASFMTYPGANLGNSFVLNAKQMDIGSFQGTNGEGAISFYNGSVNMHCTSSMSVYNYVDLQPTYIEFGKELRVDAGGGNYYKVPKTNGDSTGVSVMMQSGSNMVFILNDNSQRYVGTSGSDIKLKENIIDCSVKGTDIIQLIKTHAFDWTDNSGHVDIGVIAQELMSINKQFVKLWYIDPKGVEYYTPAWENILPYIIGAVQELNDKVEQLTAS